MPKDNRNNPRKPNVNEFVKQMRLKEAARVAAVVSRVEEALRAGGQLQIVVTPLNRGQRLLYKPVHFLVGEDSVVTASVAVDRELMTLHMIGVFPALRRRGLGQAALNLLFAAAQKIGCTKVKGVIDGREWSFLSILEPFFRGVGFSVEVDREERRALLELSLTNQ